MSSVGRILVTCWCLVFLCVVISALFPRILGWIPHFELIRVFLPLLLICSVAYGIYALYREGMRHARRK